MQIDITGEVLGKKYGMQGDTTKDMTAEQVIDQLCLCVKNTLLLRIKYPDFTDEQLEEKMNTGDR